MVKINPVNPNEIELSFTNNKKKLFLKNPDDINKDTKEKLSKKVMQINTNLEPSQSKK